LGKPDFPSNIKGREYIHQVAQPSAATTIAPAAASAVVEPAGNACDSRTARMRQLILKNESAREIIAEVWRATRAEDQAIVQQLVRMWQHWQGEVTRHAVVVVGIDHERGMIHINDPFFPDAPIEMSLLHFEIGWQEKDREYAIIGLAPPED
jgi:hypothetical protein